jgi:hypothetical protein
LGRIRPYFDEVTRALLVLALILLNFAHTPNAVVAYDGYAFTTAATAYCGEGGPEDQQAHVPCHACRIGSDAVVPPPPCTALHAPLLVVTAAYAAVQVQPWTGIRSLANRSRGPPTSA